MEQIQKVKAIKYLRPNAEFVLRGDQIEWLDENQTQPTGAEIEAGWVAYEAAQKAEAEAKAQAKAELLERLGITEAEAQLLLT
jgi:hypothetical protein